MRRLRPSAARANPGAGDALAHPSDEGQATKPAETILRQEISIGAEQLDRSARGLFLSAVSAGLDIGFGPMMAATVLAAPAADTLERRVLAAFALSIGFLIVILGRSELFTEHTTLAVLPLLSGRTSVAKVARLWGVVYAGNLVGVIAFAAFAAPIGLGLGLFGADDVGAQAAGLTDVSAAVMFGSAVAAGWLMGLGSWLVTAGRDTVGQILTIIIITGAIGFLHLHHSVAGSTEVLLAVFAKRLAWTRWARFLFFSTLGNAIGGVVLVGLIKYGHVTQVGETPLETR